MTKLQLAQSVAQIKKSTKEALQTLYDNVNKGQKKQIVKNGQIKALFDRYGVEYEIKNGN